MTSAASQLSASNKIKAGQRQLTSLLLFWLLAFVSACEAPPVYLAHHFAGETMGTTYNVTVVTARNANLSEDLDAAIQGWLDEVNQSMSTYLEDSELSTLNRAPVGEWLPVSTMMLQVLRTAQAVSEMSGGAFDVTVAPLVDLWGFGPVDTQDQVPDSSALEAVRERVGYRYLQLRDEPPAIRKERDLQLDLSAVAKGFGADYVAQQLALLGYKNVLVEIGGDLLAQGHNADGEPWRIGIEKPSFKREGVQQALEVSGEGVASSGDYRNFFREGGQIYSHILDPRLGQPVRRELASVTVIAATGARADALATAFTVLGKDEALSLAEEYNVPLYLIIRKGDGFATAESSTFGKYLSID